MRLLRRELLRDFAKMHGDAAAHLDAWAAEVADAKWGTPVQLKSRYPKASILSGNRVVFNICGNRYRLLVLVNYTVGVVVVEQLGTHAEYSRWSL